jgi:hypothetical protein
VREVDVVQSRYTWQPALDPTSAEDIAVERISPEGPPDVEAWRASELAALVDTTDPDFWIIVDSIRLMRIAGLDMTDPDLLRLGVEAGKHRAAFVVDDREALSSVRKRRQRGRGRRLGGHVEGSTVYYMRLGNRCKIGWTKNLARRIEQVQPEELLATEPGGHKHEIMRHVQFDDYHVVGEWFRYEGFLVEHVASLRG